MAVHRLAAADINIILSTTIMIRMNRTVSAIILVIVGIAILAFVSVQIYVPAVASPSYWENNTSELVPLLLLAYVAGVSLTGGIFLVFDWIALSAYHGFDANRIRLTGIATVFGGLLLVSGSLRFIFRAVSPPRFLMSSITTGGSLLLILGVVGLYAGHGQRNWKSARYGAALTAGGISVSTLGTVLNQFTMSVPVRGAVSTPANVLGNIGGLVFIIGSMVFGVRLWQQDTMLQWIGVSLIAADVVFVTIHIGRSLNIFWQLGEMIGFGIAGVVFGYWLWRCPTSKP